MWKSKTTEPKSIGRREILKTAAGTMFLAPLLRTRRAEAALRVPPRIITLFTPNSSPPTFFPEGSGSTFRLTSPMKAFEGLERKLLFARPIDHSAKYGNQHVTGVINSFTGASWVSTNGVFEPKNPNFDEKNVWAAGPSIDHIAAERIAGESPIKSLAITVGIQDGDQPQNSGREYISYSGSGHPVPGEVDPNKIFNSLFGGQLAAPAGDPAAAARAARGRQAWLDVSVEELREMQKFLGKEEIQKLDLHVTSLQDLAREISALSMSGACRAIDRSVWPSARALGSRDSDGTEFARLFKCYVDLIATTFECDRTRAVSLQLGRGGSHWYGFLGNEGKSWHVDIAHNLWSAGGKLATDRPDVTSAYARFHQYLAGLVASLAKRLDSIAVPGGTMLDNTILVWGTEMGVNHTHFKNDVPYLVAGGGATGLKTGQFLTFANGRPNTQLLTGILNALGIPAKGIGNQPACGALPGMI
jgi:hypothetical protein